MNGLRSEDVLVGVVALFAAVMVGRLMRRARNGGAFVFPRWRIDRAADPSRFRALMAAYAIAFVLMCLVSADLLLGLDLKRLT